MGLTNKAIVKKLLFVTAGDKRIPHGRGLTAHFHRLDEANPDGFPDVDELTVFIISFI
jgi:hypothetical protein